MNPPGVLIVHLNARGTQDLVGRTEDAEEGITNIAKVLKAANAAHSPVFWYLITDCEYSGVDEPLERLMQETGNPVFIRQTIKEFDENPLPSEITEHGCTRYVLTGIYRDHCVRSIAMKNNGTYGEPLELISTDDVLFVPRGRNFERTGSCLLTREGVHMYSSVDNLIAQEFPKQ